MTEGTTEKSAGGDRVEYHSALAKGLSIGRYRILAVLGEGGFGITYRCHDSQLHRDVAIKEYLPVSLAVRQGDTQVQPRSTEVSKDFVWGRSRFLDEARTMAKLSHVPAVVRVHDFLEAHGTAYVVMEILEGETLAQRLLRETRLPQSFIDRILPPLLDGLEQIHAVGFVHRDIKPANIMLAADGSPTLIDFGASRVAIANRTQGMTAIFTPGFAAPEQSSAGKQGPWTDIYGLAATLYACVAAKSPPSALDRLLEGDRTVAVETVGFDYAPNLLTAIDVGMLLQANARPQTVDAWRQVLATGVWKVADGATRPPQAAPATLRTKPKAATQATPAARPPEKLPEKPPEKPPERLKEKPPEKLQGKPVQPEFSVVKAPADKPRFWRPKVVAAAVVLLVAVGGAGYWSLGPRSVNKALPPAPGATRFPGPAPDESRYLPGDARRVLEEQAALDRAHREQAVAKVAAEEQARQQALKDAAREAEEQQARAQAERDAKANAEPGEAELRLTPRERQKLQVALTSLGFDVGGIDGTFGRRSREMIAGWQTKRGDTATGFVTAAQKTALLSDGATAIARWEEGQRRAYEEQRRAQQQQPAQQPVPQRRSGWRWPWE